MKIKYLTYAQASAIHSEYKHLVGLPFEKDDSSAGYIDGVLVAPYSRILQWEFVKRIVRGVPPDHALSICPNGRYDVILYSTRPDSLNNFRIKDLRTYAIENRLPFDLHRYRSLRIA